MRARSCSKSTTGAARRGAAGADVNAQAKGDFTPLHLAAGNNYAEVIEALLDAGADTSVRTVDGGTPFDYAEQREDLAVIREYSVYRRLRDERDSE